MNNLFVIEINYILDNVNVNVKDYQIRIIECESWSEYINNYIHHNERPNRVEFKSLFGYLSGPSLVETELESQLNELAAQGYEICKSSSCGGDGYFISVIMERDIEKVRGNNEK